MCIFLVQLWLSVTALWREASALPMFTHKRLARHAALPLSGHRGRCDVRSCFRICITLRMILSNIWCREIPFSCASIALQYEHIFDRSVFRMYKNVMIKKSLQQWFKPVGLSKLPNWDPRRTEVFKTVFYLLILFNLICSLQITLHFKL